MDAGQKKVKEDKMKLFRKINIEKIEDKKNHTIYKVFPFEKGIATTIGNSLRRILLSSISAYAIICN